MSVPATLLFSALQWPSPALQWPSPGTTACDLHAMQLLPVKRQGHCRLVSQNNDVAFGNTNACAWKVPRLLSAKARALSAVANNLLGM
jgi:hypothetical protein